MPSGRRHFLYLAFATATASAGCGNFPSQATDESPTNQTVSSPDNCPDGAYVLDTKPVPESATLSPDNPIVPSELPDEERQILLEALDTGTYFECNSASDALASFTELVLDHVEDDEHAAFVKYEEQLYTIRYCKLDACSGRLADSFPDEDSVR